MNRSWITRGKFLCLLICSTGILFIRDAWFVTGVLICIGMVSYVSSGQKKFVQRITPLLTVCIFIMVFQLVGNAGLSLVGRLIAGYISGARILSLSLLVFLFTEMTSVYKIVEALSFLPSTLQLLITISFALIPTIMSEIGVIKRAQQSRGYQSRSIFPILIPLVSRTLGRAEHIAIVIQTRGYTVTI
jgi:energy-coupling factor transporter transmembrane protein EcfT